MCNKQNFAARHFAIAQIVCFSDLCGRYIFATTPKKRANAVAFPKYVCYICGNILITEV